MSAAAANFRIFFLSSLALFAYWLRSSVVSVLFSLISERSLQETILRLFLFLAYGWFPLCLHMIPSTVFLVLHCLQVTRKPKFSRLFIACVWLVQRGEEEIVAA